MRTAIPELADFVCDIRDAGFKRAVLLGMGGSSLAPEVSRLVFGVKDGYLDLTVLDSTHPDRIFEVEHIIEPKTTLFIVSTKSGGTIETLSLMRYFYKYLSGQIGRGDTGSHFIAITDPGSGLEKTARELNFRKTFLNDPDIGGRFAALSYFGFVPAALLGIDLDKLLEKAEMMSQRCFSEEDNPGALLGVAIGEPANHDRDKLTFVISEKIAPFGAWVEQLIAESTGKDGKGILPVVGEKLMEPVHYSDNRLFVHVKLKDDSSHDDDLIRLRDAGHPVIEIELGNPYDLGAEFFRWEMAIAIAGWRLKINPFDQPNVESAKILAKEMIAAFERSGKLPMIKPLLADDDIEVFGEISAKSATEALAVFFEAAKIEGVYVAIHAYLKPSLQLDEALEVLRSNIARKYRVATTVGYGPRFLHSTGQLHKGDGGNGLFVILTDSPERDLAIPQTATGEDSSVSFGVLIAAQASGDMQALQYGKRKVIRFHLKSDPPECIRKLATGI